MLVRLEDRATVEGTCHASCDKILAFSGRMQGKLETDFEFLNSLQELANEAKINRCKRCCYVKQIVGRFIAGTDNIKLRERIVAMNPAPALEHLEKLCSDCPIDLILDKNVCHIVENIFLRLDYQTLSNCSKVCKKWYALLNSDAMRGKTKYKSLEMWMGTEKIARQDWSAKEQIHCWTTNAEEVAYVENITGEQSLRIRFINSDGKLKSCGVRVDRVVTGSKIWILRHVLLLAIPELCETDFTKIMPGDGESTFYTMHAVNKTTMECSKLFSWRGTFGQDWDGDGRDANVSGFNWATFFDPMDGPKIAAVGPERGVSSARLEFWHGDELRFRQISVEQEYDKLTTGEDECCRSHLLEKGFADDVYDSPQGFSRCMFNANGSHVVITQCCKNISVYKTADKKLAWQMGKWANGAHPEIRASSEYVFFLSYCGQVGNKSDTDYSDTDHIKIMEARDGHEEHSDDEDCDDCLLLRKTYDALYVVDIRDGTLLKEIVLPPGYGWFCSYGLDDGDKDHTGDLMRYPMTTLLTGNHLLMFYEITSQRNEFIEEVFLILDLSSLEVKHTVLQKALTDELGLTYGKGIRYGFGLPEQEYKGDENTIHKRDASVGLCGRKLSIDPASEGELAVCVTGRFGDELTLLDLRSGDPEKILESRKVIPAFEQRMPSKIAKCRVNISDYYAVKPGMVVMEVSVGQRTNFEVIYWKNEELPKAILSWKEIESRRGGHNYGDDRTFEEFCVAMGHQY